MITTQNTFIKGALFAVAVGALFLGGMTAFASAPAWDLEGSYILDMNYLGNDYSHDVTLTQDTLGALAGNGGSPAGANVYTWVVTSGAVDGNTFDIYADYTATSDAVVPLTVMHLEGVVAADGTLSGTWSDNYQGGARSGTFATSEGEAVVIASLVAADFGVVNYDTGLGILKGYTAGFSLADATFAGVQSVVVELFSGATLLQTNTATAQVGIDIIGADISSPFDVSGTFNYVTDGYWTNVREVQYGQSTPATRVVATVLLENGQTVSAENLLLTGDPTTIYPVVPPVVTAPTHKNECKNGGWKTFTTPSYKNQGQCVASTVR